MTTYQSVGALIAAPPQKQKCHRKGCPSMAYWNGYYFLCVVCDHQKFELCLGECGQLSGWCNCEGQREPPPTVEEAKSVMRKILELLTQQEIIRTREFYEAMPDKSVMWIDRCLKELWDDDIIAKPKHGIWRLP